MILINITPLDLACQRTFLKKVLGHIYKENFVLFARKKITDQIWIFPRDDRIKPMVLERQNKACSNKHQKFYGLCLVTKEIGGRLASAQAPFSPKII